MWPLVDEASVEPLLKTSVLSLIKEVSVEPLLKGFAGNLVEEASFGLLRKASWPLLKASVWHLIEEASVEPLLKAFAGPLIEEAFFGLLRDGASAGPLAMASVHIPQTASDEPLQNASALLLLKPPLVQALVFAQPLLAFFAELRLKVSVQSLVKTSVFGWPLLTFFAEPRLKTSIEALVQVLVFGWPLLVKTFVFAWPTYFAQPLLNVSDMPLVNASVFLNLYLVFGCPVVNASVCPQGL